MPALKATFLASKSAKIHATGVYVRVEIAVELPPSSRRPVTRNVPLQIQDFVRMVRVISRISKGDWGFVTSRLLVTLVNQSGWLASSRPIELSGAL